MAVVRRGISAAVATATASVIQSAICEAFSNLPGTPANRSWWPSIKRTSRPSNETTTALLSTAQSSKVRRTMLTYRRALIPQVPAAVVVCPLASITSCSLVCADSGDDGRPTDEVLRGVAACGSYRAMLGRISRTAVLPARRSSRGSVSTPRLRRTPPRRSTPPTRRGSGGAVRGRRSARRPSNDDSPPPRRGPSSPQAGSRDSAPVSGSVASAASWTPCSRAGRRRYGGLRTVPASTFAAGLSPGKVQLDILGPRPWEARRTAPQYRSSDSDT